MNVVQAVQVSIQTFSDCIFFNLILKPNLLNFRICYLPGPKDKLHAAETDSSASNRGCKLGDQFHLAGSSWHPYLPPNGFDTCAVCTCDPITLEIKCPRVQCPLLQCSDKVAYRPDKKACCKKCPEVSSRFSIDFCFNKKKTKFEPNF